MSRVQLLPRPPTQSRTTTQFVGRFLFVPGTFLIGPIRLTVSGWRPIRRRQLVGYLCCESVAPARFFGEEKSRSKIPSTFPSRNASTSSEKGVPKPEIKVSSVPSAPSSLATSRFAPATCVRLNRTCPAPTRGPRSTRNGLTPVSPLPHEGREFNSCLARQRKPAPRISLWGGFFGRVSRLGKKKHGGLP